MSTSIRTGESSDAWPARTVRTAGVTAVACRCRGRVAGRAMGSRPMARTSPGFRNAPSAGRWHSRVDRCRSGRRRVPPGAWVRVLDQPRRRPGPDAAGPGPGCQRRGPCGHDPHGRRGLAPDRLIPSTSHRVFDVTLATSGVTSNRRCDIGGARHGEGHTGCAWGPRE